MASKYIKNNSFEYDLNGYNKSDDIYISVIVGDGQYGSSSFQNLDGEIEVGPILNCLLGKKKDIQGKSIKITTTVTDTNPDTNHTIVTYQVNSTDVQTYAYDVDEDNETLFYRTVISFV